jgi:hypothetical protein
MWVGFGVGKVEDGAGDGSVVPTSVVQVVQGKLVLAVGCKRRWPETVERSWRRVYALPGRRLES